MTDERREAIREAYRFASDDKAKAIADLLTYCDELRARVERQAHIVDMLTDCQDERSNLRVERDALREAIKCEICRDVERIASPSTATICDHHYKSAIRSLADEEDENERLRERVRQLEADLKACGDTLPGPHPLGVTSRTEPADDCVYVSVPGRERSTTVPYRL